MSDFKMGFPEVVGALQGMAKMQAGQLQDILEAVRALKPAPSEPAAPSFYEDYKRENNLVHELRQAVDQLTRVRNAHADEIERLRAENEAIRKSISDGDYGPTAAELQRFRDREEKLDALWPQLQRLGEHYGWEEEIEHAIAAVRDFKG